MTVATKPEAKQIVARRELARRGLADFTRYMLPEDMARAVQPFHEMMCARLERVLDYIIGGGKQGTGRLMIFMPPGYWKSLVTSRLFPAWGMGKFPDLRVITTSYSSKLAFDNSRNCRDFVASPHFDVVFGEKSANPGPVRMSEDSKSVEGWKLSSPHRGGSWAAGVGGSITGKRAHLCIIDDPFKDRKEAQSKTRRDDLWDWYNDVLKTRLERFQHPGAIVIPQTRWHPDGLSGRLLREQAENPRADQWEVYSLMGLWEPPSVADDMTFEEYQEMKMLDGVYVEQDDPLGRAPGESLWPAMHTAEELNDIRSVDPFGFESLYQQRPYLRSGEYFKREWFAIVPHPPKPEEVLYRIRFWDKAGSKKGDGDFTVGALMSITKADFVYVEHVIKQQGTPFQRNELMKSIAASDKKRKGPKIKVWHQQDPGTAGLESAQYTNRMLSKEGIKASFETVTGDKEVRADGYSSAVQGSGVFLVRGGWNRAFIDEHAAFPGTYDDQVDICSWGFNKLKEMSNKPKKKSGIY